MKKDLTTYARASPQEKLSGGCFTEPHDHPSRHTHEWLLSYSSIRTNLWYITHAPDQVDELDARRAPAGKVREKIKALATERLDTAHRGALVGFVDEVLAVQTQRNAVMHSRWLLRDQDAMRPMPEFLALSEAQRGAYIEQWEREARASEGWRRQANDSMGLGDPHRLDELIAIERRLANASHVAQQWNFRIANMRVAGSPSGWLGPSSARR